MKSLYPAMVVALFTLTLIGCRSGNSYEAIEFPSNDQSGKNTTSAPQRDGAQPAKEKGEVIEFTGTVSYVDLEGGFFAIVADDGKKYVPANLYEKFSQAGLRVKVKARIRKNVASIHMYGVPIDIVSIQDLSEDKE